MEETSKNLPSEAPNTSLADGGRSDLRPKGAPAKTKKIDLQPNRWEEIYREVTSPGQIWVEKIFNERPNPESLDLQPRGSNRNRGKRVTQPRWKNRSAEKNTTAQATYSPWTTIIDSTKPQSKDNEPTTRGTTKCRRKQKGKRKSLPMPMTKRRTLGDNECEISFFVISPF